MARKKREKKGGRKKQQPKHAWGFYPLFGLKIDGDDGLQAPIFGDATLVSPGSVKVSVRAVGDAPHPLLLHGALADVIGKGGWPDGIPPRDQLLEVRPHAYVAVRQTPHAKQRAENIQTLLSASMFLRAMRTTAFSSTPAEVAWYAAPLSVAVQHGVPTKSQIAIQMNELVVHTPITVRKEDLRDSWKKGTPIANDLGLAWDIHKEHPVLALLGTPGRVKGSRRGRLLHVARHLQRACCTFGSAVQLQLAVTTLERLLYANSFQELKNRAAPFFRHDADLEEILTARHRLTHQGIEPSEEDAKRLAKAAIGRAWVLLDIAVSYLDVLESTEEYEKLLDTQARAFVLEEEVRALASVNDAGIEKAFLAVAGDIRGRLTLRAAEGVFSRENSGR